MIAKIHGTLEAVSQDRALVQLPGGGITLEVLLPAFTVARLHGASGETVELFTHTFLEGQAQGATLLPRIAGFTTLEDRQFYGLFITCKGIGHRRGLRAMSLATGQIAAAIEDRDLAILQSLPEIGKRTAETIVATLRGKAGPFVSAGAALAGRAGPDGTPADAPPRGSLAREALNVLVQLGERRQDAAAWIDQALDQDDPPTDAQGIISEVYRIKAGG